MNVGEEAEPLPAGRRRYRASYLELFFDLVFIFGLAQLSYVLAGDLGWSGLMHSLVALLALWWVWSYTVWMANRLGVGQPAIQIVVIGTMFGSLLMAVAAPAAFSEQGVVFAVAYLAIYLGRIVVTLVTLRGRPERISLRWLLFFLGVSLAPWIAGGLTSGLTRAGLWTLAVILAYTLGRFDIPVIRISRSGRTGWGVSPEHLGERHQHFAIIALGDTILASGLTLREYVLAGERIVALALVFATTVLLWRIYFYRAGELLADAIESAQVPHRIGLLASYAHLLMVAGIVVVAVADVLIVVEPLGRLSTGAVAAILGGPALFLAGRAWLDYTTFSRVAWSRAIGLLVLVAVVPAAAVQPTIVVAVIAALVLFGVAVSDAIAWRRHPRSLAPPAG